ncbi:MAG TPA: efflux RND transporter periplasmic adaptor subunit [Candidatus Methylacidiphilales bacterium]|nr:efflux RND transporter periplasmic adaptor subunit [Candidatus Methylacidiphilales bacterium]
MESSSSSPPKQPTFADRSKLGRAIKWIIFFSALILVVIVYNDYENYPRTDDASVTANVVGIAPRVSGPISRIAVTDNQFVRAGDVLFEIDPVPYQDAVDTAVAQKLQTAALLNRLTALVGVKAATKEQVDEATASEKGAQAALTTAQYNLDGCKVVAPFDGYITNLNISNGAYAHAADEVITMVDARNWYVIANYRESLLRHIKPGMSADVYLMTNPDAKYHGIVEGIGPGVVPEEEPQLSGLPNVQRELNWVRLAQRFPVRIRLDVPPTDPALRVGVTAIVTITGHGSSQ